MDICPRNCSQIPRFVPLFSKRVQFRKAGHFANSCSRLRAAYEDFIGDISSYSTIIEKGGGLECIVLTEVTWRGRITCSPTPMRNFSGAKGIGSIKSQTSRVSFIRFERSVSSILNKKKNRANEYLDMSFLVNEKYLSSIYSCQSFIIVGLYLRHF